MFLDAELEDVTQAKARLGVQADIRRQVIHLELLALRSRVRRSLSNLTLGVSLAGKVLDLLRARKRR